MRQKLAHPITTITEQEISEIILSFIFNSDVMCPSESVYDVSTIHSGPQKLPAGVSAHGVGNYSGR